MADENDPIVQGLLKELGQEDKALAEAEKNLREARINFEVSSRKYAAVRDVIAKTIGHNPFSDEQRRIFWTTKGRFRFIWMDVGDAIVDALKESDQPMTLEEIVDALTSGGLRVADPTRAVNAALMRTTGVKKSEDGKYRYEPDEIPFE